MKLRVGIRPGKDILVVGRSSSKVIFCILLNMFHRNETIKEAMACCCERQGRCTFTQRVIVTCT